MSIQNMAEVNMYSVREPRLNLNNDDRAWAILKGGSMVRSFSSRATAISNSQCTYNLVPPSPVEVLDRIIIQHLTVSFAITATNTGTNMILQPCTFGPRANPISAVSLNQSLKLNTTTLEITPYNVIPSINHYKEFSDRLRAFASIYPQMTDNIQDYESLYLSVGSPLQIYGQNTFQQPRGAYPANSITNGTTSATLVYDFYEPLVVPGLIWDGCEHGGYTSLINSTFINTFQNLSHMLSIDTVTLAASGVTITGIVGSITNADLLLSYITPRADQVIPHDIMYPYYRVTSIPTVLRNGSTFAAGENATAQVTNNITLSSIPLKIYLSVTQLESDIYATSVSAATSTDSAASIEGVAITFGNTSGILSEASKIQLYEISQQNGLTISWTEFSGYSSKTNAANNTVTKTGTVGSYLCFCPTKDFGLAPDLADGVAGQFNFTVRMSITNVSSHTRPLQINVIIVEDGMLIKQGQTYTQLFGVTRRNVLDAPEVTANYDQLVTTYGGSPFSKFKDFLSNANKYLKDNKIVSNVARSIGHPVTNKIADIASNFGYGVMGGTRGGMHMDGDYESANAIEELGGLVVGGKKISSREMGKRSNVKFDSSY